MRCYKIRFMYDSETKERFKQWIPAVQVVQTSKFSQSQRCLLCWFPAMAAWFDPWKKFDEWSLVSASVLLLRGAPAHTTWPSVWISGAYPRGSLGRPDLHVTCICSKIRSATWSASSSLVAKNWSQPQKTGWSGRKRSFYLKAIDLYDRHVKLLLTVTMRSKTFDERPHRPVVIDRSGKWVRISATQIPQP